jgi:hypothetical protein
MKITAEDWTAVLRRIEALEHARMGDLVAQRDAPVPEEPECICEWIDGEGPATRRDHRRDCPVRVQMVMDEATRRSAPDERSYKEQYDDARMRALALHHALKRLHASSTRPDTTDAAVGQEWTAAMVEAESLL